MSSSSRIIRAGQFPAHIARPVGVPVLPVGAPKKEEKPASQGKHKQAAPDPLKEAQEEAHRIVEKARAQAQALIADAQAQAGVIQQQAHQQGFQEGWQAGHQAGKDELKEKLHLVYQLAHEAAEQKEQIIAGSETAIVELVIDVAKKVIGEEINLNRQVVTRVAAAALEQVRPGDPLTIRVNPRDVETLMEYWNDALGENPGERHWQIVADRRVRPGGCIIDTETGQVDAQIDTQLVRIRNAFEALHGSANEREPK